ncbi:MAG: hypothetical protein M3Q45_00130 [Chloroflexota bacterium]|nr:hypothetical protein [Chloroflexota bacterium]
MNMPEDKTKPVEWDTLKAHYAFDYSKAKPNRFAGRIHAESVMVVLEPDVAAIFPTAEAVNEALRVLAAAVQNLPATKPAKRRQQRKTVAPAVQA